MPRQLRDLRKNERNILDLERQVRNSKNKSSCNINYTKTVTLPKINIKVFRTRSAVYPICNKQLNSLMKNQRVKH